MLLTGSKASRAFSGASSDPRSDDSAACRLSSPGAGNQVGGDALERKMKVVHHSMLRWNLVALASAGIGALMAPDGSRTNIGESPDVAGDANKKKGRRAASLFHIFGSTVARCAISPCSAGRC
jgi:hypothetical protein